MTHLDSNNAHIVAFECPKKGDYYWDRYRHKIVYADRDMQEKFLILEEGIRLPNERPGR